MFKQANSNVGNGCTDVPAVKDDFEIQKYIDGLSTFIKVCNTPMTIAIQGDWGTGKTSVMQMVYNEIDKTNKNHVWFNTWQFSQFDLGEKLPLLMMSRLITSIGGRDTASMVDDAKSILAGIINVASGIASQGVADSSRLTEALFKEDFTKSLDKMKEIFEKLVKTRIKASGNDRVVIFVDDLDRLAPGRAVELLEVMKNFLDCENCVFVLAIDYSVVVRGVREKYGVDFDEEKGRSFFDKIIQVPFKMPVSDYNIQEYVRNNMQRIGITLKNENSLKLYVNLIGTSIGNNPRSMKRLFNSFLLLKQISPELFDDSFKQDILFALLCMQSRYEVVYNFLIENKNEVDAKTIQDLALEESDVVLSFELEDKVKVLFINFAEYFNQAIDFDGKAGINDNELKVFREVLKFSSITATDSKSNSESKTKERDYYYARIQYANRVDIVSFRSQLRNAAMLGALAYVLIKQYLLSHQISLEDFSNTLKDNKISGDWLTTGEFTVMTKQEVIQFADESQELFEHFLTHYFVYKYKEFLPELSKYDIFEAGTDGMQITFPAIIHQDIPVYVCRYWSENSVKRLIEVLAMEEYVNIDFEKISKNITVFDEDEVLAMKKRKCGFRRV